MKTALKTVLAFSAIGVSTLAVAQPYDDYRDNDRGGYRRDRYDRSDYEPQRAGTWEAAIEGRYQNFETIRFGNGITLDPDSSVGAGFSIGYNFDPYLNLSFEIFGDNADYKGSVDDNGSTFGVDGSLDTSSGQFNVTYHWFDSAVTPFISAGVGWTYIDSNIVKNYAGVQCWYHPWYGSVCEDVYNTYHDTVLSYNAAIGVRIDMTDRWFLRGSVGRQWIYMDSTSTHPEVDFGKVELGMMF